MKKCFEELIEKQPASLKISDAWDFLEYIT